MALNFPAKIYQILENESSDIIRWHQNGLAFRIVDPGRFEREIIPKYFRHNQLSSVQRQLNLYGFKCIGRGEDKGAFYHPKFKRGDWEVVKRIIRFPPKKGGERPVDDVKLEDCTVNGQPFSAHQFEGAYSAQPYYHSGYTHQYSSFLDANSAAATQASWAACWPSTSPVFVPPTASAQSTHGDYPAPHFLPFSAQQPSSMTLPPVPSIEEDAMRTSSVSSVSSASTAVVQSVQASAAVSPSIPPGLETKPSRAYVKLVNDVAIIDPDFDLEAELEMFGDMGLRGHNPTMSASPMFSFHAPVVQKKDMAVNTDTTFPVDAIVTFEVRPPPLL